MEIFFSLNDRYLLSVFKMLFYFLNCVLYLEFIRNFEKGGFFVFLLRFKFGRFFKFLFYDFY